MCSPASSRDHSYQYDQPDYDVYDDDDESWENEEAPYETDAEILTEPMTVTVTRGDTVKLPCEVKSKGHIQRIWSRPDTSSKEQLFIGETRVSPNTRISVAGDLLIIDSVGEEEAGQYECKLAVNQGQDKQVNWIHLILFDFWQP